jgi:transporter family-2 protein
VAVVIVAVAIGAVGERGVSFQPVLFLLLFMAGASAAVQQAANGQLRAVSDDVVVASFISFLGGSVALVVAVLVTGDLAASSFPSAAWLYLGGPLGVVYILVGAATVKALGVLRFVLGVVAGQLLAAVVIDAAWPAPHTVLKATTVIGAVVTLVGVWLSGRDETAEHRPAGSS